MPEHPSNPPTTPCEQPENPPKNPPWTTREKILAAAAATAGVLAAGMVYGISNTSYHESNIDIDGESDSSGNTKFNIKTHEVNKTTERGVFGQFQTKQ